MLHPSEKSAVTAALHFTTGVNFALKLDDMHVHSVGGDLFAAHAKDAEEILKTALAESDPELTYERLGQHFRMIYRSMSPDASGYAARVLQLLEPKKWLAAIHEDMGFKS